MLDDDRHAPPEQRIYARWIDIGTKLGFLLLAAAFFLYMAGVIPGHIPPSQLPGVWDLPVDAYLQAVGSRAGWSWARHLGEGDFLSFVGISVFAAVSALAAMRVVPAYWRRGERAMALFALGQALVVVMAASGLIGG
jgi:hypothetical protein